MQLAHRRRRSGPFRGQPGDRSLGAVLVEAAFVTPVFFMLVLGLMEVGLAMNDKLALASTVRAGTRVASASGNDPFADYGIIQAIVRESAALPQRQIKYVVIYKATAFGQLPSDECRAGNSQGPTTTTPCNVYTVEDFDDPKDKWNCVEEQTLDKAWCPRLRDVVRSGGTDYVGVWMKVEHPWLTRMFGNTVTLTDQSVIRLEPRAR